MAPDIYHWLDTWLSEVILDDLLDELDAIWRAR
jgi:hypothetical protein